MSFFSVEDIDKKLGDTFWSPIEVARFNDSIIRAAVFKGEYHWHEHKEEDECFFVIKGCITIDTEQESITLREGEGYVVPRGVQHRPRAEERSLVLLIEPAELVSRGT